MDQPPSKPSTPALADDPTFLASLAELDSGLSDGGGASRRPAPQPQPPASPTQSAARASAPSRPQAPRPPAPARPAQPAAPVALPTLIPPPPGGRRALLDLFPPPPSRGDAPPDLSLGVAPPPVIGTRATARSRHAATPPAPLPASYETFYGLQEKPFSLSTDPRFLYHTTAHDQAAQDLISAIRRRDGLVVLTGEIGVGKTILCRAVVEELDRRTLTSLVLDPFVSVEQLLQTILLDFGVVSRDDVAHGRLAQASREELFGKLREFLASLLQLQAFAVVLIDEAQNLPPAVLEEIRALMDLDAQQQQRLLQVVLVGRPSLLTLLGRREGRELRQRVAVRAVLKPLAPDEITGYVMYRLAIAGARARVELDERALALLYTVTGGVPRVVNLVCDRALTLGHNASASVIDEELIATAAHDLDVVAPAPEGRRLLRAVAITLAFVALMGVGAGAAALVFRAPLSRMVVRWEAIPARPRSPALALPVPLAPVVQN